MDTLQLKLSLAGTDATEVALVDLQKWLNDAGIYVEPHIEPPTAEELGGKITSLVLILSLATESTHLPPSVEEGLHSIHTWRQRHQTVQPVVHLTGQEELDEKMKETVRRHHWHIELRELESPPKEEVQVVAPPPPKPPTKK